MDKRVDATESHAEYFEQQITEKTAHYDRELANYSKRISDFVDYTHKEYLDFYRNKNRVKAEISAHTN
jgi:hypothetical protein